MISFEINNNEISRCTIEETELEFIDDVAICEVDVYCTKGRSYRTLTLLKRTKSNDDASISYSLVNSLGALSLDEGIVNITRIGQHFIIERNAHNFDKTRHFKEYHQVDLIANPDNTVSFREKPKIPGFPITTDNEEIVIIKHEKKMCLYSLDKGDIISTEFSGIEDINGETFLVTDTVASNYNAELVEQLIFSIKSDGDRNSDVYVRSTRCKTDDDISLPYILIRERILQELDQTYLKSQEQKQLLRRG